MFISILGVEGISLDNNLRKALIGLSGGIVVAIQSIGNAFPVKQRAGGYKALESQARTIKSKLGYLKSDEEIQKDLPNLREQFYGLVSKSAELD